MTRARLPLGLLSVLLVGAAVPGCKKDKCASGPTEAQIDFQYERVEVAKVSRVEVELEINGRTKLTRSFATATASFVFEFKSEDQTPHTLAIKAVARGAGGAILGVGAHSGSFTSDACNFITVTITPGGAVDGGVDGPRSDGANPDAPRFDAPKIDSKRASLQPDASNLDASNLDGPNPDARADSSKADLSKTDLQMSDVCPALTKLDSGAPPTVTVLAGAGPEGYVDGPAATAQFSNPYGVAVDSAGRVYVAELDTHRIRLIFAGQVSTFAGSGPSVPWDGGFADGPALTVARFNRPTGVAVDSAGQVYVADSWNHRIRVISGGQVSTLAGDGIKAFLNGPALAARFNEPRGVAVGADGTVYVADTLNTRIRVIAGGQVSTFAGTGVPGHVDGSALSKAQFEMPGDVAVDTTGKVYVPDGFSYVRLVAGGQVSTFGDGTQSFLDGPAAWARFNEPTGVAVDSAGKVYVADSGNIRIRLISCGWVTTMTSGPPFGKVTRVAVDGSGKIYASDRGPYVNTIRVVSP
jgi:sugar lactone lactonase YvrE